MAVSAKNIRSVPSAGGKRETILRAAIKVFAGNGYFSSKVSDIASEAGIADGTVYLYFKSKDEILHSIFDRAMEEFIRIGKQEIADLDEPQEKLRRVAKLHLERLGDDRDMAIVFQVELRGSTKFMEEFSAAGFADYLEIISEIFAEGRKAAFSAKLKADRLRQISTATGRNGNELGFIEKIVSARADADVVLEIFLGVLQNEPGSTNKKSASRDSQPAGQEQRVRSSGRARTLAEFFRKSAKSTTAAMPKL